MAQINCKLPSTIDKLIFNSLGGFYHNGYNVDNNLENTLKQNQLYLGTYFPRSYCETNHMFSNFFKSKTLLDTFLAKKQINILDFGTGTGGNIIGLMDTFSKNSFNTEAIKFYIVEGNKIAIDFFTKIFNHYNTIHNTKFKLKVLNAILPDKLEDFTAMLYRILQTFNINFDIITSSKMLNEFYNRNPTKKGYYTQFTNSVSNFLNKKGVIFLTDVVCSSYRKDYSDQRRELTSIIMAEELKNSVTTNSKINFVAPIACAWWSHICRQQKCYTEKQFIISHSQKKEDISKICFRLLATKEFAHTLLAPIPVTDKIKVSNNNKTSNNYCSYGIRVSA